MAAVALGSSSTISATISAGVGDISIAARGFNGSTLVSSGRSAINTTLGSITISAVTPAGTLASTAVDFGSQAVDIRSVNGNILIIGEFQGTQNQSGISLGAASIFTTGTGNIELRGQTKTGQPAIAMGSASVGSFAGDTFFNALRGSVNLGSGKLGADSPRLVTSSGNIRILAEDIVASSSASIRSTGNLVVEPLAADFANGFNWAVNQASGRLASVRIGKSTTPSLASPKPLGQLPSPMLR
jgi:hypothetical protein